MLNPVPLYVALSELALLPTVPRARLSIECCGPESPTRNQNHCMCNWFWPLMLQEFMPRVPLLPRLTVACELPSLSTISAAWLTDRAAASDRVQMVANLM